MTEKEVHAGQRARKRAISSRSLRARVQLAQAAKLGAGIVYARRSSAHSAMMLSRVWSKLAHDSVRNAVQLTVAELAAVESHPYSHPQWVLGKNRASAVVDARVWLAFRRSDARHSRPVVSSTLCNVAGHQPKSGARAGATSAIPETSKRTRTSFRKPASSRCP